MVVSCVGEGQAPLHHGSSRLRRVATSSWILSVRSQSAGQDGEEGSGQQAWVNRDNGGGGVHGDLVRENHEGSRELKRGIGELGFWLSKGL